MLAPADYYFLYQELCFLFVYRPIKKLLHKIAAQMHRYDISLPLHG